MRNPLGVNTWVWVSPPTDENLSTLAPKIAGWGFDAIEIPIEDHGQWDPSTTAELVREHNLIPAVCAAMSPERDLTVEDTATVESTQAYLRGCVDAAATVGSKVVGGPMYAPVGKTMKQSPTERDAMLNRLADNLRPVAEYAQEANVRLGVEPLNRFETSVLNTTEQALDLVDRVGSDGLGLMLDTFHMHIEERDLGAAIRAAGNHVVHLQTCGSDRGAPGGDGIDWQNVANAVAAIGYDGPLCIESFTSENETIAKAAAIWRPLAESQDALATNGLAFLRDVFGR